METSAEATKRSSTETPVETSAEATTTSSSETPAEATTTSSETPAEATKTSSSETPVETPEGASEETLAETPPHPPMEGEGDAHANPEDIAAANQDAQTAQTPGTAEHERPPWTYADATTRYANQDPAETPSTRAADTHSIPMTDFLQMSWKGAPSPRLALTGQYAISGSTLFLFTQLIRIDDNQVISSLTEEIPLTWRLQNILGLPTPTLKAIGPPAQVTSQPDSPESALAPPNH